MPAISSLAKSGNMSWKQLDTWPADTRDEYLTSCCKNSIAEYTVKKSIVAITTIRMPNQPEENESGNKCA